MEQHLGLFAIAAPEAKGAKGDARVWLAETGGMDVDDVRRSPPDVRC